VRDLHRCFVALWHLAVSGVGQVADMDPEYAKLMGADGDAGQIRDARAARGRRENYGITSRRPFYDNGPNDKGVGIQLAYSIARVLMGYLLAVLVAIPIGFLIGMSPLMSRALDPFIQV
jgi:nitrate/nitrite transport system permease protein